MASAPKESWLSLIKARFAPKGKVTSLTSLTTQATANWGTAQSYTVGYAAGTQIKGAGPEAFFGPLQPLSPMAPPGTGGRQWDYRFGRNLDYNESLERFEMLRNLADNLPLLRVVIEKRKDQIAGWDWDIQPVLTGKDKRKAASQGPKEDPRIGQVRQFMRRPDRRYSFHTWMRAILEDMLVLDAACIYPRMTRGGDLYSLDFIDGSTIFPLINGDGRAPLPEDGPAYQQRLHGLPAADFTLDELRYLPRNVRSNRVFGYSPVEMVVLTVNIALRRELFNLEYYNTGSLPDAFGTLPEGWTTDQIRAFQDYFDGMMSGNLADRRKLKFMPYSFKAQEVRSPPLKDQYDEWLARVICAVFSIPASPFVNDNTRATAQTVQIAASQEGIQPLQSWIKDWMDSFIQIEMGFTDLEFVWSGNDKTDPLVQAQCDASDIGCGVKSVDEVRVERGLDPLGIGPTVVAPVIPLIEAYNQAVENIKNPPQPLALPAPGAAGASPNAKPNAAAAGAPKPGNKTPVARSGATGSPSANARKAGSQTLYVHRPLQNADALIDWAKSNGFKTTLPGDDMHVTQAFSRAPIDWSSAPTDPITGLSVGDDGARLLQRFGKAVVLKFNAPHLTQRFSEFADAGASWDHPEYQPHVTLSYAADDLDLSKIKPYDGDLLFGPEAWKEVNSNWEDGIVEK